MLPPVQTQTYQPRPQQLALSALSLQTNQTIQGANNPNSIPHQAQNVPLPPPVLGPFAKNQPNESSDGGRNGPGLDGT